MSGNVGHWWALGFAVVIPALVAVGCFLAWWFNRGNDREG